MIKTTFAGIRNLWLPKKVMNCIKLVVDRLTKFETLSNTIKSNASFCRLNMRYAISVNAINAQIKRARAMISSIESSAILAKLFLMDRRTLFIIRQFKNKNFTGNKTESFPVTEKKCAKLKKGRDVNGHLR